MDDSIMSGHSKQVFKNSKHRFGSIGNSEIPSENPLSFGNGKMFSYTRTLRKGCKHLLKLVNNAQMQSEK